MLSTKKHRMLALVVTLSMLVSIFTSAGPAMAETVNHPSTIAHCGTETQTRVIQLNFNKFSGAYNGDPTYATSPSYKVTYNDNGTVKVDATTSIGWSVTDTGLQTSMSGAYGSVMGSPVITGNYGGGDIAPPSGTSISTGTSATETAPAPGTTIDITLNIPGKTQTYTWGDESFTVSYGASSVTFKVYPESEQNGSHYMGAADVSFVPTTYTITNFEQKYEYKKVTEYQSGSAAHTEIKPPLVTAQNKTIWVGQAVPGITQADGVEAASGITNAKFNNYGGTYNGDVSLTDNGSVDVNTPGVYTQTLTAKDNNDNTTVNTTRTVTVKALPTGPGKNVFTKEVTGDAKLINAADSDEYEISFDVPADVSSYTKLTLTDTLPAKLQSAGTPSASDGPAPTITAGAGGTLTWTADTAAELAAVAGKTVVISVPVKLAPGVTASDNGVVINTANLEAEYDPTVPPGDIPEDPPPASNDDLEIKIPLPPSGFQKTLFDGDGKLNSLDETATYKISMQLPADLSEYKNINITDDIPAKLQVAGTPAANHGVVTLTGNNLDWNLTGAAALTAAENQIVEITVPVKAAEGTTIADNGVVTNTANSVVTYTDDSTENLGPATNNQVEIALTPTPSGLTKAYSAAENAKDADDKGQLNHSDDTVEFTISAVLPNDLSNFNTFSLIDTLPAGLVVDGTPVVTADNTDVTSSGTFSGNNTIWTISAVTNQADLNAMAGKTVTMTLKVKGDNLDYTDNATLTNKGSWNVTVKDGPDPVDPTPEEEPVDVDYPEPPSALGKVLKSDTSPTDVPANNSALEDPTQSAVYTLSFTMPTDVSQYEAIKLTDTLPDELQYVSAGNVQADGTNVSGFTFNQADKILTWTADTAAALNAVAGKNVTVDITVKAADDVTSADNGTVINKTKIEGTYKSTVPPADRPADPPEEENDDLQIQYPGPNNPSGLEKKAIASTSADGKLHNSADTITYEISEFVPDSASIYYDELRLIDEMPPEIERTSTPVVLKVDGVPVTTIGSYIENGSTLTWTIPKADISSVAGKKISMEIEIKGAPGLDYNANHRLVENVAKTEVDWVPITPDPPEPVPPQPVPVPIEYPENPGSIVKELSAGDGKLNNDTEQATYTIKMQIPRDTSAYAGLTISDILPDELELDATPIVRVDGTDVTAQGTFTADKLSWTTIDQTTLDLMAGKEVSMELKVSAISGLAFEDNKTVVNKADVSVIWDSTVPLGDIPQDPDQVTNDDVSIDYPKPADKADNPANGKGPQTGDENNIGIYLAIAISAALLAAAIYLFEIRRRRKEY